MFPAGAAAQRGLRRFHSRLLWRRLRDVADGAGACGTRTGHRRARLRQRARRLSRARGRTRRAHAQPPGRRAGRTSVQHPAHRALLLVLLAYPSRPPSALQRALARSGHAVGILQPVRGIGAREDGLRRAGQPPSGGADLGAGLAAGLHTEDRQPAVPAPQRAHHAHRPGGRGCALRALVRAAGAAARLAGRAAELRGDDAPHRPLPRHDLSHQPHRHARHRARREAFALRARDQRDAQPGRLAAARLLLRRPQQPYRAPPVPVDADRPAAWRAAHHARVLPPARHRVPRNVVAGGGGRGGRPLQGDVGLRPVLIATEDDMNLSLIVNLRLLLVALLLTLGGCSVRQAAVNRFGDVIAQGGAAFGRDDDPELIRAAAPCSLKLIESLLEESPAHKGLLLAAARGFTQYAYAFVQQEAEEAEGQDLARTALLEERARRLYRRARDYGLRGLALDRPGFSALLRDDPRRAVLAVPAADVPLLYWSAASWGALIGLSKGEPEMLGQLPVVEALIDRALALDESFDRGAIHSFLIGYEQVRQGAKGDPADRSREHFARAMQLSAGADAAPLVALAEAVCVPQQRRAEFETLLHQALSIDTARPADNRLANMVAQRRALWLLSRTEHLFSN